MAQSCGQVAEAVVNVICPVELAVTTPVCAVQFVWPHWWMMAPVQSIGGRWLSTMVVVMGAPCAVARTVPKRGSWLLCAGHRDWVSMTPLGDVPEKIWLAKMGLGVLLVPEIGRVTASV